MSKQYSMLALIIASEVLKGEKTLDWIKFPAMRQQVEEIVSNQDLVINLFADRLLNGLETLDSIPDGIRTQVEEHIAKKSTNVILLVADILDGTRKLQDIPEILRDEVISEIERYVGKKLEIQ